MTEQTHLNASSRIMFEEAQKMGISCQTFGDHETVLMKLDNLQWFVRGSRTSAQSSVGKTIADYKPLTKKILTASNLPTAKGIVVRSVDDLDQLKDFHFPVVMKPLAERHGKGVVVGVKDIPAVEEELKKSDQAMLIEESLKGTEYRIICVNYKFVAAAFRKPAHVVGDGKRTIQELVTEKNKHPWRGEGHSNNLSLIQIDEIVMANLAEQSMTLDSVPSAKQEVLLRKTANLSTGGEAWDVSADVSDENKKLFEDIAKACDLNVAGIDMMCQNLTDPITKQSQAGVIEVNASPGLRMHHYPMQGQPINVAKIILEFVISKEKVCQS